jgi:hypothetical protein
MSTPVSATRLVILRDHDPARPIGHGLEIQKTDRDLTVSGAASIPGEDTDEFIQGSKNGFPWRASIGCGALKVAYIQEDETLRANGQEFPGPLTHVVSCELREVSVVSMGADDDTESVAASDQEKDEIMKRIKATAAMTSAQPPATPAPLAPALEAGAQPAIAPATPPPSAVKASAQPSAEPPDFLKAHRETQAAEIERCGAIQALQGIKPELAAQAIREGWTLEKTELTVLRAARPQAPNVVIASTGSGDSRVLAAALCQTLALPSIEKHFVDKELQAAHTAYRGRIGLQQLIVEAARRNGYAGSPFLRDEGDMRTALKAAFSSDGLDSVFVNVMNLFLMTAFNAVEDTWREIARINPTVNDFREYQTYANISDLLFEDLGPTGKIKHGYLKDVGYKNQLSTKAKMISITRADIINHAIGVLRDMTAKMGRGAALKLNVDFWTEFLNDATFFSTDNKNLLTGTANVLAAPGLKAANTLFRQQVGPDGYPLGISPEILLTPPELEVTSAELMTSTLVNTGGAATDRQVPNRNIWAGKFKQATSVYLSNGQISGGSATAYYLLAKPEDLPVIEIGFLRGAVAPTIQQVQPDADDLGIVMRGWWDYGVRKQVAQAGVKVTGKA